MHENLCCHRKKQFAVVIICYAVLEHLPFGRKFWNGDKWYKFPKSQPFHWKFGNSGKKVKSNGHSRSFVFTSQGCHLFWKNQITVIFQKFKPGFSIACEQVHLFGVGYRGQSQQRSRQVNEAFPRPILFASSHLGLPIQTSKPAGKHPKLAMKSYI